MTSEHQPTILGSLTALLMSWATPCQIRPLSEADIRGIITAHGTMLGSMVDTMSSYESAWDFSGLLARVFMEHPALRLDILALGVVAAPGQSNIADANLVTQMRAFQDIGQATVAEHGPALLNIVISALEPTCGLLGAARH